MRFQVPQFIESEDAVVWIFSLRQFIYISISSGLAMILFFVLETAFWIPVAVVLVSLGIAVALVKVPLNGQPLTRVARSAAFFYWKPQVYVWQPEHPEIKKTVGAMESLARTAPKMPHLPTFSIDIKKMVGGKALKAVHQNVQTGTKESSEKIQRAIDRTKERYEVYRDISGGRSAAKKVDY